MTTHALGTYRARMDSVSLGKSANKGTPEIRFNATLIGKHGVNGLEACNASNITVFRYVSDGTIDFLIQELAWLGYNRESFAELDSNHPNAFPWPGVEFDVGPKVESYDAGDGKGPKDREKWEFRRGAPKGKPIEKEEVSALDAKYGAYLKDRAKPQANGAAPSGARNDSAIPF